MLIVSDSKHSLVSAIAEGITVDFSNQEKALSTIIFSIKDHSILSVIATDDLVVTLSSKIAQKLGIPSNHPDSTLLTFRKDLARLRLKERNCNTPEFSICHVNQIIETALEQQYPVVLKPLMLSGSRGVIRANNAEQFIAAAETIKLIISDEICSNYERHHFLVEKYLQGEEVAIDAFIQNGKFILLAIFDKPEPLEGPYFEESYYITPSQHSEETQQKIISEVSKCCQAYGLSHGPIHAEARITTQGVVIIEIASRTIGGQCAQLIEYTLGTKLEDVIIRLMCMQSLQLEQKTQYAGVLMIPIESKGILKRIEGITSAQKTMNITDVQIHINPGYELVPLPIGNSYLGFIFASADSFSETYSSLTEAYKKLNFITQPNWKIEPNK